MQESRRITRKSASNLALAFVLLPKARRDAMSALYAFCREVDDVADDEGVPAPTRRERLERWRSDIRLACGGGSPEFQVNRELQPVIRDYGLALEHFEALLDGVEMDLELKRYETFEQLEVYCYRVASVVGLLSIPIFGYRDPACRDYAVHLGKALQLTNILRDVRVDAERDRIYLPASEMAKHNVTEAEILGNRYSDRYARLAETAAARARVFYGLARQTLPPQERRSMVAAELMGAVYWRLLEELERRRFDVFTPEPTRLGKGQKLFLISRTWLRWATGSRAANYGG